MISTRRVALLLLLASVWPARADEATGFDVLAVVVGGSVAGGVVVDGDDVGDRFPEGPVSTRRKRSLLMVDAEGGGENVDGVDS